MLRWSKDELIDFSVLHEDEVGRSEETDAARSSLVVGTGALRSVGMWTWPDKHPTRQQVFPPWLVIDLVAY